MRDKTVINTLISEKSSAKLTGLFKDENDNAIPSSSLSSLTLTLYPDGVPATFINSRNKQSILNVNGGVVDSSGNLTINLTPDDNQIVDSSKGIESHIALLEWTFSSGTKAGRHEVALFIANMSNVP